MIERMVIKDYWENDGADHILLYESKKMITTQVTLHCWGYPFEKNMEFTAKSSCPKSRVFDEEFEKNIARDKAKIKELTYTVSSRINMRKYKEDK